MKRMTFYGNKKMKFYENLFYPIGANVFYERPYMKIENLKKKIVGFDRFSNGRARVCKLIFVINHWTNFFQN